MPIFKNGSTRRATSPVSTPDVVETQEAAENIRYINMTGYKPYKQANIKLTLSDESDAALINFFDSLSGDELELALNKLQNRIVHAQFNAGRGEHEMKRYINVKLKDDNGTLTECAFFTLFEDNEQDIVWIDKLDQALDADPEDTDLEVELKRDVANQLATDYIRSFNITYESGVKKTRSYSFMED